MGQVTSTPSMTLRWVFKKRAGDPKPARKRRNKDRRSRRHTQRRRR